MDFLLLADINECEDEAIRAQCQYGCENTDGSYRCLEPSTTTSTTAAPSVAEEEEKDYDEEDNSEETTPTTTPTSVPNLSVGPACSDGLRRDVNGVCTGESLHARRRKVHNTVSFFASSCWCEICFSFSLLAIPLTTHLITSANLCTHTQTQILTSANKWNTVATTA